MASKYLNESQRIAVEDVINKFTLATEKLADIAAHFIDEMRKGLDAPGQTVRMIPSYGKCKLCDSN
jgi:hexokinase